MRVYGDDDFYCANFSYKPDDDDDCYDYNDDDYGAPSSTKGYSTYLKQVSIPPY
jgi:hypothetical protein